jgi:hypothetical protein
MQTSLKEVGYFYTLLYRFISYTFPQHVRDGTVYVRTKSYCTFISRVKLAWLVIKEKLAYLVML